MGIELPKADSIRSEISQGVAGAQGAFRVRRHLDRVNVHVEHAEETEGRSWQQLTLLELGEDGQRTMKAIMVDLYFLILSPTDLITAPGANCPGTKPPNVS